MSCPTHHAKAADEVINRLRARNGTRTRTTAQPEGMLELPVAVACYLPVSAGYRPYLYGFSAEMMLLRIAT